MIESSDADRVAVSRGAIENICMIHAIPTDGCSVNELPALLGLSPLLAEAVAEAIAPMVDAGWVQIQEGHLAIMAAGRAWVEDRLTEIGIENGNAEI